MAAKKSPTKKAPAKASAKPKAKAKAKAPAAVPEAPASTKVNPKRLKGAAKETRNIACTLTMSERDQRGQELAAANVKKAALLTKRSIAADTIRKEIKEADAEITRLTKIVGDGREMRDIVCATVERPDGKGMDVVREDTLDVIESRPFTPEERQGQLFKKVDSATEKALKAGKKASTKKKAEADAVAAPSADGSDPEPGDGKPADNSEGPVATGSNSSEPEGDK